MYKRDFGILLISAFAVYYALQHEGSFQFRRHWYHRLHDHEFLPHSDSQFPLPIVADLNGDGSSEIIVAGHDAQVQVLAPRRGTKPGAGFAHARLVGHTSLAPPQETQLEAWGAITIAAGHIDLPPQELVRAPRKQVLVVVTANLHVHCFDHNLRLLWTKLLRTDLPPHATVHEVAVHITPARVNTGDRGLVVVGFSIRLGDHTDDVGEDPLEDALAYEAHATTTIDNTQQQQHPDMQLHAGMQEHTTRRRQLLGSVQDEVGEVRTNTHKAQARGFLRGVDLSRHFSYYAFEGGSGQHRWTHEGTDFHKDMDAEANRLTPQHNYRLNAEEMAGRHFGELSCREFRDSVLKSLPHAWLRRSDTRMVARQFVRNKVGREGGNGGDGSDAQRGGGQTSPGVGVGGGGNVVSRTLARLVHVAGRGGGVGERKQQHLMQMHSGPGNALVSHLHEGIEAIHLYTGRTLCKLHLPSPGLHVDLNGDGIVDHVQAYGGHAPHHISDIGHRRYGSCMAVATSGIPPREHLFNSSICTPRELFSLRETGGGDSDAFVEVVPPVMLPTYRRRDGRLGGIAIFANSKGDITALGASGERLWQVHSGVLWARHHERHVEHAVSSLQAIPLRVRSPPVAVLVSGVSRAAVLSEHGHVLESIVLPEPPIAPLVVADFSGDGLVDVIVTTASGYFGLVQVRRPGGSPFGALVGTLIVVMVAIYLSQATSVARRGKKKYRSTDRTE